MNSDQTAGRRAFYVRKLSFPLFMICGALASDIVVVDDFATGVAQRTALDPGSFKQIEFLARNSHEPPGKSAPMRGCNGALCEGDIGQTSIPLLSDPPRLSEANAVAAVLVGSEDIRHRSLRHSPAARMAELELLAAEQFIALQELEIDSR